MLPFLRRIDLATGSRPIRRAHHSSWSDEHGELAEGPGFEPGLTGPEPVVLPLDDPSALCKRTHYKKNISESRKFFGQLKYGHCCLKCSPVHLKITKVLYILFLIQASRLHFWPPIIHFSELLIFQPSHLLTFYILAFSPS